MYHPDCLEGAKNAFKSFNETGTVHNAILQLKRKDGSKIDVMLNVTSVKNENGDVLMSRSVWRDITDIKKADEEKKKLEKQLLQSQKMESIGRLAGGIAYDFSNILTGIMGYTEILKMQFPDINFTEGKAADTIYKGSERAADLTSQLLGFAREGKHNPVIININEQI